jgi:Mechanosensitive ion channel, conserved TM helix
MDKNLQDQFLGIGETIIAYLPSFLGGIILVGVGWVIGWIAKRIIIQASMVIHLERFLTRFSWAKDLSRADVRYGFYGFLGNLAFLIVFIIFLDNALIAWKLTVLSSLIEKGIEFFPRIIVSLAIFGIGWFIATWASNALQRSLQREGIPRSTLISRFTKIVLLLLFSAMALTELNVAREIVIIGFATIFITLGMLTIVLAAVGGKEFIKKIQQSLDEE